MRLLCRRKSRSGYLVRLLCAPVDLLHMSTCIQALVDMPANYPHPSEGPWLSYDNSFKRGLCWFPACNAGSLVGVLFRKFRRQQGTGAPFYGFLLDHYSNPWCRGGRAFTTTAAIPLNHEEDQHISDSISQIISVISLAITVMFVLHSVSEIGAEVQASSD
eukprot:1666888-Amphidinium_carterae.1